MKVLILLFLYITVTCQAQQWSINGQQVARQGDEESEFSMNDRLYEKLKTLAKKYMKQREDGEDPNILTLFVPDVFKSDQLQSRRLYKRPPGPYINSRVTNPNIYHQYPRPVPAHVNNQQHRYSYLHPSRFASPAIHTRLHVNEEDQMRQTAQAEQKTQHLQPFKTEEETRLAQVDKEALSKLSKEDRQILESELSVTEREALLTRLEDGQLDDIFPREENRFGGMGSTSGGFSGAVAQIGASAGRYIGGKLAGSLGARLGAAAGAYLGAAAASRFVKKTPVVSADVSDNNISESSSLSNNYGAFGAVMVNKK